VGGGGQCPLWVPHCITPPHLLTSSADASPHLILLHCLTSPASLHTWESHLPGYHTSASCHCLLPLWACLGGLSLPPLWRCHLCLSSLPASHSLITSHRYLSLPGPLGRLSPVPASAWVYLPSLHLCILPALPFCLGGYGPLSPPLSSPLGATSS